MFVKSDNDIKLIKKACEIWKKTREVLLQKVDVGMSLLELDKIANDAIEANGGTSAFYNYHGFPGKICISVNKTVVHGVPDDYVLKDGDLVTFDVGVKYQEHFADAAFSVIVGQKSPAAININQVCYDSLMKAIQIIKPNVTTNYDLSCVIEDYVTMNGYEVIRNFSGHGCGNHLHEDPIISNYRSFDFEKVTLVPGMVICIEPMIMTDSNKYIIDKQNNWAVHAKNKKLTCHWEHMVLITENGYEILTE